VLILPVKITNLSPGPRVVLSDLFLLFQRIGVEKIPQVESEKVARKCNWRLCFDRRIKRSQVGITQIGAVDIIEWSVIRGSKVKIT
jgi:hypothetical protein